MCKVCKEYSLEIKVALVSVGVSVVLYCIFISGQHQPQEATFATVANAGALFIIAQIYGRAKERKSSNRGRAYDIFLEWHSKEIRESRIYVSRWIKTHDRLKSLGCAELDAANQYLERYYKAKEDGANNSVNDMLELDDPEKEEYHFFKIYQFFERWATLVEEDEIDQLAAIRLMSSYTNWYKVQFIEPWLKCEEDEWIKGSLEKICKNCFS